MSTTLATGVKKRKKSETKPQAQINKCNNEKRRREQENIYIEELAELISANFADMSSLSVKPDKCAILQETVNQIRSIKRRESEAQSSDPVQQGEVSSSRPTILSNEVYGPLLLEALEGFLFVVNIDGRVEHVTENVSTYIKFTRDEVLGKSIYNFIHHGDHAQFSSCLLPMTIGWASEPTNRSRSFSVRLLVKPPDDTDESVEEKQQRISSYEVMQISSTQLRDQVSVSEEDGSDSGPCLLCVASRISHRDKTNCGLVQLTTKLDTTGKVINVDASGVPQNIIQFIKKELMDKPLRDRVPQQDVQKFTAHLMETVSAGQSTSAIYRLQIGPDKFVQVQTKSKYFKMNPHSTNDPDFIIATHSIIGENDALGPTDPGGGSNTNNSNVGGPLLTGVVNGTRNGASINTVNENSTTSSNNSSLLNTNTTSFSSNFQMENDFGFDNIFPTSTWDLESTGWNETRPDSRQSVTPVSTPTPRPPSNPSYSPATTVAQSPLAHFVTQPSPTVPNPSTPADPYNSTFAFGSLTDQNYQMEEQKDTKANVLEDTSMVDSARLRNLLTKGNDNKDKILKDLLSQSDEDSRIDNRSSPRGLMRPSMPGPSEPPKTSSSSSGGNNMLLELLKNNDDDLETKADKKKGSELLQQLLKPESRDNDDEKKNDMSQDDSLLRSLGFSPNSPTEPGRARKRPSDDRDENPNKRSADGSQVSSSGPSTGGSKLSERNKMLASLLAKQPPSHQPIPPVPQSVITATPQEKLPRITDPNKNLSMGIMNQNMPQQQQQQHQQQQQQQQQQHQQNMLNNTRHNAVQARMANVRPNYLNTILSVNMQQRNENNRQMNQANSNCYTSPATSSTDNNNIGWDNNNIQTSTDQVLSDILDQVIDFVPDEYAAQILDGADGQQANNFQTGLSETMAIHIIQKNLMQCESAMTSSPSISLSGTPPAYSSASMTSQTNQFPPPPNYPQGYNKRVQVVRPTSNANQYTATLTPQQQLLFQQQQQHQQQQKLKIQQEHKRRLLQQQKQQQLLIPSNAAAADINPIQNIDSLLNNPVAPPNVSLQRSSSVPESQLSPNYGNQLQQRVNNQQQPYSPHSQLASPIGQQSFPQTTTVSNYQANAAAVAAAAAGAGGARLSPQAQYSQLSPRQAYPQGNTSNANWQQTQARLSVQQNPMLNAQLTGNYLPAGPNGRNFQRPPPQQQQPRSINSPGTVPARHSPYPADQFQPPTSPNSAFNQSQYLRIQRANSAPTATTQLPGGLGSPRPYSGREHHPLSYPNIPPSHHSMMYHQQDSYCYDQTGLQLAYNGADRGRMPQHLQPGVSGSGPTSEFVRQELRAVVGARTAQAQPNTNRPPSQLLNQQQQPPQQVTDLEDIEINFNMSTGASDSPKLWGAMGSDMGSMSPQPATSRNTMEEARQGDQKSSLLQKLLSE